MPVRINEATARITVSRPFPIGEERDHGVTLTPVEETIPAQRIGKHSPQRVTKRSRLFCGHEYDTRRVPANFDDLDDAVIERICENVSLFRHGCAYDRHGRR